MSVKCENCNDTGYEADGRACVECILHDHALDDDCLQDIPCDDECAFCGCPLTDEELGYGACNLCR